jgi:REP-associated tyrosine transposase
VARLARAVVPSLAHHITQRGNRRQRTFFCPDDYLLYIALLAEWCGRCGVEVWAYCLMPNHVHLIAVPGSPDALRRAIGEAHRRYTADINRREGWRGHLWQGRFASYVMDDRYTLAAARYVELNPVRAGLVARAEDYLWSSARAHLLGRNDCLVNPLGLAVSG